MMYKKAINSGLTYIISRQQKNGGFLSLSSCDPDFKKANTVQTTFITSLILLSLQSVAYSKKLILCRKKAAEFLLSQKSEHWSWNYWTRKSKEEKEFPYPDDLDDTFCAVTALFQYDKTLIDGSVFAKMVMLLTAVEKKEGGPYATWLVGKKAPRVWKDIDIVVNSNVAYFLSLNEIELPNIQLYIDRQISKGKILSPYYVSNYPSIYFLSRFYSGLKKKKLIKLLISQRDENGRWGNPLQTALAISALLNLGAPPSEVIQGIEFLIQNQKNGHWKAYPFVNERVTKNGIHYGGSSELSTAFCIEAIEKYVQRVRVKVEGILNEQDKDAIYLSIMKDVEERFVIFDSQMQQKVHLLLDKIVRKDTTRQIPLLPYYFAANLIKQKETSFDQQLLIMLGEANVYGWIAYTILDDFLDDDATDPQMLCLATLALRELTVLFMTISQKYNEFQKAFTAIMDKIDCANAWEIAECRFDAEKTDLENIILPDFGDNTIIAEKSLGHCLGPIAVLHALGYKSNAKEMIHLVSFFTHFLIAKQLNDDAHDWEADLLAGHINPINAKLLSQWRRENRTQQNGTVKFFLPKLKEYFWMHTIIDVCELIQKHLSLARAALHEVTCLSETVTLESFLLSIENAVAKAKTERTTMLAFLKTYHE